MKKFYNNTKMSGAFSKALRVLALLCVLLGMSGSAWGSATTTIYFDNTNTNWSNIYIFMGHSGYSRSDWQMTKVSGNIYKCENVTFWDDATQIAFANFQWDGRDESIESRMQNQDKSTYTKAYNINKDNNTDYIYVPALSDGNYKLTQYDYSVYNPGGGDDTDNCDKIEIYCKYNENPSDFSMKVHVWSNGGSGDDIDGGGYHTSSSNNGTYAYWSFNTTSTNICIQISNNNENYKSGNMCNLKAGNKYYFDIPSGWQNWTSGPTRTEAINCGGSGDDPTPTPTQNILYLKPTANWDKDKAWFAAYFFKGGNEVAWVKMEQSICDTNNQYWYVKSPDAEWSNVIFCRMNPASNAMNWNNKWNKTADLTFDSAKPVFTINSSEGGGSWGNGYSCSSDSDVPVLLANKPVLDKTNNKATLSAYLKYTLCNVPTEWGFVLCNGEGCTPTASSALKITGIDETSDGKLLRGELFTGTSGTLAGSGTYGYKGYVKINGNTYISEETDYFSITPCEAPAGGGDPITFTVNLALGENHVDDCNLIYGSLETAINKLKSNTNYFKNKLLLQDVYINVHPFGNTPYVGTKKAGVSGGGATSRDAMAIIIEDINNAAKPTSGYKTLTIQSVSNLPDSEIKGSPIIQHGILRNSRNVVLDNLIFYSDQPETAGGTSAHDDALEFDTNPGFNDKGEPKWWEVSQGQFSNANIVVRNCYVGSDGFTGIHICGYDGITFENNEFAIALPPSDAEGIDFNNMIGWGASAKFINTTNIKFIRNNFMGAHATMVWLQECTDVLFMNNVFWSNNSYNSNDCSAISIINQYNKPIKNLGFYYNTFFLNKNDKITAPKTYDFFKYDYRDDGNSGSISGSTIEFMYNNCYSYCTKTTGKGNNPANQISSGKYCPNNFWSVIDPVGAPNSTFSFSANCAEGVSNPYVNVKNQVCSTTATGPASLVIRGAELDLGVQPATTLAKALGADKYYNDRNKADNGENAVRKKAEKWTYGAYQKGETIDTKTIIWQGNISDNWDDRNNWIDAETNERLSCLNNLDPDLKVIIPEERSTKYKIPGEGVKYWPNIPANFNSGRATEDLPEGELVSAGIGKSQTPIKYAGNIELEYGAGLKGAHNLNNGGTKRYTDATMNFTADRSRWILVGTVVKDGENYVKSGKYYFENYEPYVYMHYANVDNSGMVTWSETFTSLEEILTPHSVYAVNIPDEYGSGKVAAKYYYKYYSNPKNQTDKYGDGTVPKAYVFTGDFLDDREFRTYETSDGNFKLLNNSYPCNIDATKITTGNVYLYDYITQDFELVDEEGIIKPQHGFVYKANNGKDLTITEAMLVDGDTKSRSAEVSMPTINISAINLSSGNEEQSKIIVKHDELHDGLAPSANDAEKAFSPYVETPSLYMMAYDKRYARLNISSKTKQIPLGIKLNKEMIVQFKLGKAEGFETVKLYDALTDTEHNLLGTQQISWTLPEGTIEGRFFLNVTLVGEDYVPDTDDDDITTNVDEVTSSSIGIYADGIYSNQVSIVGNNTELQFVYVTDMAGRTSQYEVSGSYASIKLPSTQGVYVVNVIGDNASRIEKVIVK